MFLYSGSKQRLNILPYMSNFVFKKGVKNLQEGCICRSCKQEIKPSEPFAIINGFFYCKDDMDKKIPSDK